MAQEQPIKRTMFNPVNGMIQRIGKDDPKFIDADFSKYTLSGAQVSDLATALDNNTQPLRAKFSETMKPDHALVLQVAFKQKEDRDSAFRPRNAAEADAVIERIKNSDPTLLKADFRLVALSESQTTTLIEALPQRKKSFELIVGKRTVPDEAQQKALSTAYGAMKTAALQRSLKKDTSPTGIAEQRDTDIPGAEAGR